MKYKNFDDFFSSIDINKNEMIDNWENLKKRKKKITIITTIVMITINKYRVKNFKRDYKI